MVSALQDLPLIGQVTKYFDGCSCARGSKEEVAAIKQELEKKDAAIERLEQEIRRKDMEKDNLMTMQKVLQEQISQIRADLEAQSDGGSVAPYVVPTATAPPAAPSAPARKTPANQQYSEADRERAAAKMQARSRGQQDRRDVASRSVQGLPLGDPDRALTIQRKKQRNESRQQAALRMQARQRGKLERLELQRKIATGEDLRDDEARAAIEQRKARRRAGGLADDTVGDMGADAALAAYDEAEDEESVDSDYDYDDSAFAQLGVELLSGKLKLAKVYGQEEPPAAEGELEWELRYFVLYDGKRMCHYDGIQNGQPVGDRGMVLMENMKSVEKVLGVDTFVLKGDNKVYLLKLEPHDEAMMRTWISAISQQLQ